MIFDLIHSASICFVLEILDSGFWILDFRSWVRRACCEKARTVAMVLNMIPSWKIVGY